MRGIDLIGQRFGYIKAIKATNQRLRESVMWECLCDCGNLCYFSAKQLKETKLKSCGCVPPHIKDLKGQVFGKLEVLSITNKKDRGNSAIWRCQCTCGNKVDIPSRSLLGGNAKSCGCKRKCNYNKNRKRKTGSSFDKALRTYQSSARKKSVSWKLTEDETYVLFKNNCYYCGVEPSNGKGKTQKGNFLYSGIDRVDNIEGYVSGNVVSCCKECNLSKGTMSLKDFEDYIYRLYNHYFIEKKRARI